MKVLIHVHVTILDDKGFNFVQCFSVYIWRVPHIVQKSKTDMFNVNLR